MNTRETVAQRLLDLCDERRITINRLSTLAAVPPSTIKNILYGKSLNPGIVTIKMLCDGLGITLGEFFHCSAFDKLEQEIKQHVTLDELKAIAAQFISRIKIDGDAVEVMWNV